MSESPISKQTLRQGYYTVRAPQSETVTNGKIVLIEKGTMLFFSIDTDHYPSWTAYMPSFTTFKTADEALKTARKFPIAPHYHKPDMSLAEVLHVQIEKITTITATSAKDVSK